MEEVNINNIIEFKIVELEDKLMRLIEMANNYPNIPIPIFEGILKIFLQKSKD